jgi:hypothetical protein
MDEKITSGTASSIIDLVIVNSQSNHSHNPYLDVAQMLLTYLHPRKQFVLTAACEPYESKKANTDTNSYLIHD